MTVPAIRAVHSGTAGAPLLVLGPSLGTSTLVWEDAAALLETQFSILAWDLPGHGASPPASESFTVGELADAVLSLVETSTFHYAGVSLGGAVGLELALRHPGRVNRLSMICSLAKFGEAASWRERAALVRAQSTSALVGASAGRWFSPRSIARLPEVTGRLLHNLADADDESYALCCEALAGYDLRGHLGGLTRPLLAIAGLDDPVAPPGEMAELAAAVPDGRSVDLPDAGHLANAEQPGVVAELLVDFFQKGRRMATDDERREQGMSVRREVLGDEHVDRANAGITEVTRDFQDFITRYAWGDVWSRPGLDRRLRSTVTITALIAHGHWEELGMHLRAALRNGLTQEEVTEIILQSGVYCGVPAANSAFRIAQEVFDE